MLWWRFISAAVIIAVLAVLVVLDINWPLLSEPGMWLLPLLLTVALLAAGEMLDLLGAANNRATTAAVYIGVASMVLGACAPMLWRAATGKPYPVAPLAPMGLPMLVLGATAALLFVIEMARFDQPGGVSSRIAMSLLTVVYCGGLISFMAALRFFGNSATGMLALLSVIIVVKSSDIGAYTFGRLLGRNKAVPKLSPGKTVEGVIGGLATACLVSWLVFEQLGPRMVGGDYAAPAIWSIVLFGLVVGLAGIAGDLAISLIKRDFRRKDSSTWLPGLGGVLDVLDSLLVSAPAAFLWWTVFG